MRKILFIVTVMLMSTAVAFSQEPVEVGYAVVTPAGGASGMAVFETFGLRRTSETTQAGVLPADLTTDAVIFVSTSGRLQRNLGVAIANPNPVNLTIILTLRDDDGTQIAETSLTLPARQQTSKFVTELFPITAVQTEFLGTLRIRASGGGAVGIVGLRFRGDNFSTLPATSVSALSPVPVIGTGIGGIGAVLLPQFAAGGLWASQIVIANTGTTSLTARVDLFRQDGTSLRTGLNGAVASSFTNIVVPAGGVVSLAPRNALGEDDF